MFQLEKDYHLQNPIAKLSPLQADHLESLYQESQNEGIWKYFLEEGLGRANFEAYFFRALDNREKGLEYPFVIKDLRQDAIAGMTRVYQIDNQLKNVRVGHTWIGERFQGSGLNKNGKYLLFEFLFDQLQMHRIGFGASAENTKSIRAMKAVGCREEGRFRSFMPGIEGRKRVDVVLLSILREEWEAEVKGMLKQKI